MPWWRAGMLAELAELLLNDGRVDEGEALARDSLIIADELLDRACRIFGVGLLACAAAERGESERAGRLWGAIEGERAFAPPAAGSAIAIPVTPASSKRLMRSSS